MESSVILTDAKSSGMRVRPSSAGKVTDIGVASKSFKPVYACVCQVFERQNNSSTYIHMHTHKLHACSISIY